MDEPAAAPGRRRRRRRPKRAPDAPVAEVPAAGPAPTPEPREEDAVVTKPRRRKPAREAPGERGLRDIVGAGRSQLGVSGALRARDVNRPSAEDLAEAERDVAVVRRNWKPPG